MLERTAIGLILVLSVGCASSGAKRASSGSAEWAGSFRSSGSAPSALFGPATPNRGTGAISRTPLGGTPAQTRVELTVNVNAGGQDHIAWALLTGGCGSPGPSVVGQNEFPPIPISSSGDGHLKADLAFTPDPKSTYHANVYWTAHANDMNDVMMCANVKPRD